MRRGRWKNSCHHHHHHHVKINFMLILPQSCNFVIYPTIFSFRTDIFFPSFCFTVNFSLRIFVYIPTLETAVSEDDGSLKIVPVVFIIGGSQWGDGFYGHRLKFCPFYSSQLTPLRPSDRRFVLLLTLSQIGRG